MADPESRLIREAQRGAAGAADELFRRHWRSVWQAAYAVTGRRELANDAAQEAFVRAISSLDTFDANRPLRPWVTKIAVNAAIDELRREGRLTLTDEPEPTPVEPAERQDDVLEAVARLSSDRRVVLALHYWLDYSTPEISELLDLPLGTVASRLSRALNELRLNLEAEHV
jgi:RNA polymerase sigma-70 factor (ECF subfamily)